MFMSGQDDQFQSIFNSNIDQDLLNFKFFHKRKDQLLRFNQIIESHFHFSNIIP